MKQEEKFLHAAMAVIQAVIESPDDQTFGGETMGSGLFARPLDPNSEFHKVVIPGDSKQVVLRQLTYLFADLAVDLHLSKSIRDTLYGTIYGRKHE